MIGKVYGSLIVIKYDAETATATVRCECGTTEYRKRRVLEQGRARICRDCKERARYFDSVKAHMERVKTLKPAIAARVMRAFARHLAMCKKYKATPTRLAIFINEALADADFGEEMDQSFAARYLRSNPQSYRQYERPRLTEMI